MMYYDLESLIYFKIHFSTSQKHVFSSCLAHKGQHVLTKRSTSVDQNLRSDKVMSKLSAAIFATPRTHLGAQKSLIY